MENQKLDNMLSLALDATARERKKSLELNVGYDQKEETWELIVKYSGSLKKAQEMGIGVVYLQNEYAIVTVRESLIEAFSELSEVEFIEKPKRLFFEADEGVRVSCISQVRRAPYGLTGKGVLIGIIDSGIDYEHPAFRGPEGTTRIRALWDQSIGGNPPKGYLIGTEYTGEQIDEALSASSGKEKKELALSRDISGHGTAVAGVAAGGSDDYLGVAYESELIVVKLGLSRPNGFPRTTELMQAIDYVIGKGLAYEMPVAINISFGNTYGSHEGDSLLEQFIQDIANRWKSVICIGMGNEGSSSGHVSGILKAEEEAKIELAVQEYEAALNLQIWKAYYDEMAISIRSPSGVRVGPVQEDLGTQRFLAGDTEILLYYGEPSPYSVNQEIFLDFIPKNKYIQSGIWTIVLTPIRVIRGVYDLYLPSAYVLNKGTGFLFSTVQKTLTIPAGAPRTVGVGAYDPKTMTYADFSGRGSEERRKPDLAAPGVNILAPVPGGGYGSFSGTSFATPFVTGSGALLMQWGIVEGNDPYLYGEKVKAYLQRGARPLPGFMEYPNPQVGYGALCASGALLAPTEAGA